VRAATFLIAVLALSACGADAQKPVATKSALQTLAGLTPPRLTVTHAASGVAPGFLFIAEKGGKSKPSGPVIADNRGRIVWYHQVPAGLEATDFRVQTYRGKPVLTWWQGTISKAGVGVGEYVIYDDEYRELKTFDAGDGLQGDLHEFKLTPRGTALITVYTPVPKDLTAVGGPKNGFVYDSVVQEIDIESGDVKFEWHGLDHVALGESLQANQEPAKNASEKRPFDYLHINSVNDAPGGNIIISGRNTSALYLLARDGHVIWRLGGKKSDFGPPADVKFRFQHDAQLRADGTLTLFDNGAIPKLEPFTRPLVLKIDETERVASIQKTFVHPLKISSPYEGNLQLLGDGGALVGWGGVPKVTEFTAAGKVRFELKVPYGDTYRAYRLPWNGRPGGRPSVAMVGDRVYASWNGKTDIAFWEVLAGPDEDHLTRQAGHDFAGLETTIQLETPQGAARVRALDAKGRVLGESEIVTS
jgi:hypothetical protein